MTQTEIRIRTKVLAGKRVEVTSPELTEGDEIEVILHTGKAEATEDQPQQFANMMEFIRSLTPIERTPEEWAEVEREFQEDRNSWDD